jgi:hypothetical protein
VLRWILFAQGHDFTVEFIPGKDNVVSDGLSRIGHTPSSAPLPHHAFAAAARHLSTSAKPATVTGLPAPVPLSTMPIPPLQANLYASISAAQAAAPASEQATWAHSPGYAVATTGGQPIHFVYGKFCIPADASALQTQFLRLAHDEAGHGGPHRIYARLHEARISWPGMRKAVNTYYRSCARCQLAKAPLSPALTGTMDGAPITGPFDTVQIDYVGPYPVTERGNAYLLTAICCFTRWSILRATPAADGDTTIRFIREIIRDHGRPRVIQFDNGSHFANAQVLAYLESECIAFHFTTPYHAESNGMVERQHRTVLESLRAILCNQFSLWDKQIDSVSEHLNSAFNRSIGCSNLRAF